MSVVQLKPQSPGETSLIARAEGAGELSKPRREALDTLRRDGLPNRRVEAWHYTDLKQLLGTRTEVAPSHVVGGSDLLAPLLPNSHVIEIGTDAQPTMGVSVLRGERLPNWQEPVNHLDRDVDTIRMVNVALGTVTSEIVVAAGDTAEAPIELRATPEAGGRQPYVVCSVGAGAEVTIVERVSRTGGLSASVADLTVGDEAKVLWIVDQEKADDETHLGQLNIAVGRGAQLTVVFLNAGGALVRQEIHTRTAGEDAEIRIRGVNLLKAGQHVDVTTTLHHTVENTRATEILRNVVTGGRGVFQGMIKVAPGAQKTDARLACNSLLLSDDGEFSAKPELEIFADDVQCGHGATAGEINADHLFYLMSRGIPAAEARALLIKAFVAEVVEEIEDPAVVEALEARIDRWLEANR
ncbi:Fe-S cluster assembly protein SufD [Aurantimonas sp. MSK8Z-1]|uniref:Fe-S cluster assembly protein SufD n=1 Tax=Mangrovibrevibacter kandeliae TaxID=2968473 RepID=UPI0021186047|nr:Fe-S cluster assembly protein SufD [Aurantimonas sp. MSK8Z-1]MCW4114644.1 Fe-S cluster assembly protein SufD [Aurantimonas sp. MSK8Z-1]